MMSKTSQDQMEEINKLQEAKFNKKKLQDLKNSYMPLFDALHIAKASFQCTYNANDSKFYQTSFHDLKLIHNEQNLDLFSGYINEAESRGLDISVLKKAYLTLQDLCTPSSENIKIESMDIYIQDNIINPVWDFQFKIDYPGSQETCIVSAQTSMFDIYTDCLNLIISSMDIHWISVLSRTCNGLLRIFRGVLQEHASIQDRLVDHHFKYFSISTASHPHTIEDLKRALEQIPYKKYRYKLLELLNFRLLYLINTETECIDILNLCPQSYQILKQRKSFLFLGTLSPDKTLSYKPLAFGQYSLVNSLKIPECEAGRQLFRELLRYDSLFVTGLVKNKCENWVNFFIETFKSELKVNLQPKWLFSLSDFKEKSAILFLQIMGNKLENHVLMSNSSLWPSIFQLLKIYPKNVALELLRILDDKLVRVNGKLLSCMAVAIYLTQVDPENLINSKFIRTYNESPVPIKLFNHHVLELLPEFLWEEVLKDKAITIEMFKLLPDTLKTKVLVNNYNTSLLKPDEVSPLLAQGDQWCLATLCNSREQLFDTLKSIRPSQKMSFIDRISNLQSIVVHTYAFEEILSQVFLQDVITLMNKYLHLFDKSALVYAKTLQNITGTSAPIISIHNILYRMTKDLEDSPKWDKLNLVKRWIEETETFDSNLQDQILLLIRDICEIRQGSITLFQPNSLKLFNRLCMESNLTKLQIANSVQYASVPIILESKDLEMRNIDSIPGLLNIISTYLNNTYSLEEWFSVP